MQISGHNCTDRRRRAVATKVTIKIRLSRLVKKQLLEKEAPRSAHAIFKLVHAMAQRAKRAGRNGLELSGGGENYGESAASEGRQTETGDLFF